MKSGGLLFAGHSENFTYVTQAFKLRGQTVYGLSRDAAAAASVKKAGKTLAGELA
jgi:chemotaxis protein methyltransferase CheR